MRARRSQIRSLPFRHNLKPGLGFEIFRLAELFARADRRAIDHGLDVPQRPDFHTLYVGLRGRGRLNVDFAPCPLGAGWLTVVARGRVQSFAPERGADAWMLLFSPEFVAIGADPRQDDPLRAPRLLWPSWPDPALPIAGDDRRELVALCAQLATEQARPLDAVQAALLAALLRAVLLRAERLAAGAVRAAADPAPPAAVERFLTILERDHARTRNVAHYARAAGVSPRRLGELVGARLGRTAKQVIADRVVLEQKRLLAHTDISVKELADRTGFAEPTNLVKFFRLRTGQTPLDFRAAVHPERSFSPSRRRS
jgi:AraC-like DNA-binding protein